MVLLSHRVSTLATIIAWPFSLIQSRCQLQVVHATYSLFLIIFRETTRAMEGSIFSAKNQNTVGLFNANVDFSLVTINAIPKQYEGLSNALSSKRRENAWNGQHHQTARRLGAIFSDCIPDIEVLSDAYGRRASEIASCAKLQTEVRDEREMISDHQMKTFLTKHGS